MGAGSAPEPTAPDPDICDKLTNGAQRCGDCGCSKLEAKELVAEGAGILLDCPEGPVCSLPGDRSSDLAGPIWYSATPCS
jgi:hypothetical protein